MASLVEYLQKISEEIPVWLQNFNPEANLDDKKQSTLQYFLNSRLVFYPGSGDDGGPITVFNRSHSAHCFLYVDYLLDQENLEIKLNHPITGIRGYHRLDRIKLEEIDLQPLGLKSNIVTDRGPPFPPVNPYGFIDILERDDSLGEDYGAKRIAIMFRAEDGYETFDRFFCQPNSARPPFCIVVEDHCFGGGYDTFGNGGILHALAKDHGASPNFILTDEGSRVWDGFKTCECDAVLMGEQRTLRKLYQNPA